MNNSVNNKRKIFSCISLDIVIFLTISSLYAEGKDTIK